MSEKLNIDIVVSQNEWLTAFLSPGEDEELTKRVWEIICAVRRGKRNGWGAAREIIKLVNEWEEE